MTEIRCKVCNGTKRRPSPAGKGTYECGACLGTGESTDPWDRPLKGVWITLPVEDFARAGLEPRFNHKNVLDAILAGAPRNGLDFKTKQGCFVDDIQPVYDKTGKTIGVRCWVGWINPTYAANLAAQAAMDLASSL